MTRPQSLLALWFGLGATAIGLGYFMSTSTPNGLSFLWLVALVAVSYLAHRLWEHRPNSFSLFWVVNGVSAVIVIALMVQLIGLFFYWTDLRRLSIWLICLLGVVATNAVYGAFVHYFFDRSSLPNLTQRNS